MDASEALVSRVHCADRAVRALASSCAVVIERHFSSDQCARWASRVAEARDVWTHEPGGEHFSLGRVFYMDPEGGKSQAYFAETAESDARVDAYAPGLQQTMRDLVASVVGESRAVQRRGFCGPGVRVVAPRNPASTSAPLKFETEGLPPHHVQRRRPAITLFAMLQESGSDGGLQVWDVRYDGRVRPNEVELRAPSTIVTYRTGDVVLLDSYRLCRLAPSAGSRALISAAVHAAQIDTGLWECWL